MLIGHRHPRTLVVLLALAVPASCSTDAPPAARMGPAGVLPADPDPFSGAPEVGACHRPDLREVRSSTGTRREVGCDEPHTTYTFHVGRFAGGAATADEQTARRTCARRFPDGVGLDPDTAASTTLGWTWFEPTGDEWASGSRWFRCDAVAETAAGLQALPAGGAPYFSDGVDDRWARCIRSSSADRTGGATVSCDQDHDYRWAGSFAARVGPEYTVASLRDRAARRCPGLAGTTEWWSTWPTAEAWAAGERRVSCYRRTAT